MSRQVPALCSYIYSVLLATESCSKRVGAPNCAGSVEGGKSSRRISIHLAMDRVRSKNPSGTLPAVKTASVSKQVRESASADPQASTGRTATISDLPVQTGSDSTVEVSCKKPESESRGRATGQPGARSHSTNIAEHFASAWTTVGRKGKPPKQSLQGKGPSTKRPDTVQTGPGRKANRRWKKKQRLAATSAAAGVDGVPSATVTTDGGPAVNTAGAAGKVTGSRGVKGATLDSNGAKPTVAFSGGPTSNKKLKSAKRSGKNERAAAKRARLEDSNSPRVEPKKQCTEARRAGVTYAQKVKSDQYIAVTDVATGHISQDLSTLILNEIDDKILREALADPSKENPKFGGKPRYEDGHLKLFVEDEYSLNWLRECVSGVSTPSNVQLVVKRQSEMVRRVRCGVLIPNERGKWKSAPDVGVVLHFMNKWAQVDRWLLQKVDEQQDNLFLITDVPEDVVPTLLGRGRQLLFGSGSVYLKFQGPGGKFVKEPPVVAQTSSKLVITGVSSRTAKPQSSTPERQQTGPDAVGESSAAQPQDEHAHWEAMLLGEGDEPEPAVVPSEGEELSMRLEEELVLEVEEGLTKNGVPLPRL